MLNHVSCRPSGVKLFGFLREIIHSQGFWKFQALNYQSKKELGIVKMITHKASFSISRSLTKITFLRF